MKVESNSSALLASFKNIKEEIDRKLRVTVCSFSARMVEIASYNTPLGDADLNENLYEKRWIEMGLSPIEGLARGGWQAGTSASARFQQIYGDNSIVVAKLQAYDDMYSQYNLGEPVYISNMGPYIRLLENNISDQTNGMGILKPSVDQIVAVFRTDFQTMYKEA